MEIMGLLDKLKNNDITRSISERGANLTSAISTGLSGMGKKHGENKAATEENAATEALAVVEAEPAAPVKTARTENQPLVIDSLTTMQTWLEGFEATAKPAALQTLQQQIQVLNFVQSPTMAGMAVDNMMTSLNRALKYAETEIEKDEIREAFTSMIQNFMFFTEARLRYAIESNREETAKLLSTAGELLSNSVKGVASLAAEDRRATVGVVIKNIFAQPEVQKQFFSAVVKWIGNKTGLQKKEAEYNESLANLFDTLDMYASLIGPSILVHGMLKRYIPQVMDSYRQKKYKLISDRMSDLKRDEVFDLISNTSINVKDIVSGNIGAITGAVADIGKKMGTTKAFTKTGEADYETICSLNTAATSQIDSLEHQLAEIDAQAMALAKEISETSFFQLKKKSELSESLGKLEKEKESIEPKLKKAKAWQSSIEGLLKEAAPVKEDVDAYEARLNAIVAKFSIMG